MMQEFRANSYLFGGNAPYVEELYEAYLDNPGSVPDNWRAYFDAMQNVPAADGTTGRDVAHAPVVESFAQRAKANAFGRQSTSDELAVARKQVYVQSLIAAYRSLGSRWADLDPLKRTERPKIPELEPAFYDLSESDMDMVFSATNTYFTTDEQMTLRQIVQALRDTYCSTIGAEYMHITDPAEKRWWQQKLESIRSKPSFSGEEKMHILDRITAAGGLERYLHTKYVGQKRFSLEGGESFIASMDEFVQRAGEKGVQEIVIGMAHRGRLNVLVNTLGKMPKDMFAEFDHTAPENLPVRRREVPPGLLERHHHRGRPGPPEPGVQPLAPRDRQSGRRGIGEGAARSPRRPRGRHRPADPRARRRRVRRPGRRDGDARARAARAATTPAARCTSSSTTRSASPPATRATRARRCTAPTS